MRYEVLYLKNLYNMYNMTSAQLVSLSLYDWDTPDAKPERDAIFHFLKANKIILEIKIWRFCMH